MSSRERNGHPPEDLMRYGMQMDISRKASALIRLRCAEIAAVERGRTQGQREAQHVIGSSLVEYGADLLRKGAKL